jgi:hypothetical protein
LLKPLAIIRSAACLELLGVEVVVVVAYLVDVLDDDDVDAGVVDGAAAGDEHGVVNGLVVAVRVGADHHVVLLLLVVAVVVLLRVRVADDDEVLHVARRSLHGGAAVLPRQRDDGVVGGPGGGVGAVEHRGEVLVELGDGGAHLGSDGVVGSHCWYWYRVVVAEIDGR